MYNYIIKSSLYNLIVYIHVTTNSYNSNFIVAPLKGKSNLASIYVMMLFILQMMNGIENYLNPQAIKHLLYMFVIIIDDGSNMCQCFYRQQNSWRLFIFLKNVS